MRVYVQIQFKKSAAVKCHEIGTIILGGDMNDLKVEARYSAFNVSLHCN